jgi:hypothetical protein
LVKEIKKMAEEATKKIALVVNLQGRDFVVIAQIQI